MSSGSPSTLSRRKKRGRLVFETVSSIQDSKNIGEKASVDGVVTSLSPKKGKFFDGSLEDKSRAVRFVGFNEPQRLKIEEFVKQKQAVKISNCKVQKAYGGGDGVEIVLNDQTMIGRSDKDFEIEFPDLESMLDDSMKAKDITLSELDQEAEFQRVNVKVKVAEVAETMTLDNNRKLQNVTVADESGTVVLTLWQDYVGKLTKDKTYRIENLMVKIYRGEFSLTTPKVGINIHETEDLRDVVGVVPQSNNETLLNAKVVAVQNLQCYRLCPVCKNGQVVILEENNSAIGRCIECSSTALTSVCESRMSSQLIVMCNKIQYQLRALGPQLCQIANKNSEEPVSEIDLLLSEKFDCKYTEQMNIINVDRKLQQELE